MRICNILIRILALLGLAGSLLFNWENEFPLFERYANIAVAISAALFGIGILIKFRRNNEYNVNMTSFIVGLISLFSGGAFLILNVFNYKQKYADFGDSFAMQVLIYLILTIAGDIIDGSKTPKTAAK